MYQFSHIDPHFQGLWPVLIPKSVAVRCIFLHYADERQNLKIPQDNFNGPNRRFASAGAARRLMGAP
jgi:hypothetical protein